MQADEVVKVCRILDIPLFPGDAERLAELVHEHEPAPAPAVAPAAIAWIEPAFTPEWR